MKVAWRAAAILMTLPGAVDAQERPGPTGWALQLGALAGYHVSCADCQAPSKGGGVVVGVERHGESPVRLGVVWSGAWFRSRHSPQSRHDVQATLTWERGRAVAPFVRLGAGLTAATLVTVDGPPEPPGVGDIVVGVFPTVGVGASLGGGVRLRLRSGLALALGGRLHGQRAEGRWISNGDISVSLLAR